MSSVEERGWVSLGGVSGFALSDAPHTRDGGRSALQRGRQRPHPQLKPTEVSDALGVSVGARVQAAERRVAPGSTVSARSSSNAEGTTPTNARLRQPSPSDVSPMTYTSRMPTVMASWLHEPSMPRRLCTPAATAESAEVRAGKHNGRSSENRAKAGKSVRRTLVALSRRRT